MEVKCCGLGLITWFPVAPDEDARQETIPTIWRLGARKRDGFDDTPWFCGNHSNVGKTIANQPFGDIPSIYGVLGGGLLLFHPELMPCPLMGKIPTSWVRWFQGHTCVGHWSLATDCEDAGELWPRV